MTISKIIEEGIGKEDSSNVSLYVKYRQDSHKKVIEPTILIPSSTIEQHSQVIQKARRMSTDEPRIRASSDEEKSVGVISS